MHPEQTDNKIIYYFKKNKTLKQHFKSLRVTFLQNVNFPGATD